MVDEHAAPSTSPAPVAGVHEQDAAALAERHGGHWGAHPDFPVSDWQDTVANGETRLGYWAWVADMTRVTMEEANAMESSSE